MKVLKMKYRDHYLFKVVAIIVTACIGFSNKTAAQFDGGIETVLTAKLSGHTTVGSTLPLAVSATATINPYTSNKEQYQTIKNVITLSIIEETTEVLSTNFTARVRITVDYGNSSLDYEQFSQALIVTWDKDEGTKYNAKNYISFDSAKYVKVTVDSIVFTPSVIGVTYPEDILLLKNEMLITRYYHLASDLPLPTLTDTTIGSSPLVDSYLARWAAWPDTAGNNATQLEWTWVEDELVPGYYLPSTTTVDIDKLFFNNSTRIDLPNGQNEYRIPLFYDGAGKLYYRVRAVNFHSSGTRADGAWSDPGIVSYVGHNNDLNWQVRTSFAEEGKRKSVIEYYDGSLRSRQTVTKDNVNNTTVTAETLYDYEGRPAVQILPAPGINSIVKYQAGLNLFNGTAGLQTITQNHAAFFDLSPVNGTGAALYATAPLDTSTGTSRYYSPANDELNTGPNKNIPDAQLYPYTVTRYTPDATGRIMAQSGVGPAHKMGSGRETKYYYGTPAQEELDGLFGTEVGNFTHYFKNMVRDANGQMSVSYVDMHGRTIATALAGDTNGILLPLDINDSVHYYHQSGDTIKRNLLNRNTNVIKNNSIEAINTILVPDENTYAFEYILSPGKLELEDCNENPICYDCLYDLEISITDESCDTLPVVWKFTNVSLNPDDSCSTTTPRLAKVSGPTATVSGDTIRVSKRLMPGSYAIRKTLMVSEASLQHYKEIFLTEGKGICKTEKEIIDSVYNVLSAITNCDEPVTITCDSCRSDLGEFPDFRVAFLVSLGIDTTAIPASLENEIRSTYDAALLNCDRLCDSTSQLLSSKRQLMLADMMPYNGQYAKKTGSGTMHDKYNIFANTVTGQPFYKKPWDASGDDDYYRDNDGNVDEIIHPGGSGYTTLNATPDSVFAQLFVSSWANALLPHHPEYDRLVYAETNLAGSYDWIHNFLATETYADAAAAGYIMINSTTTIDPFYTLAGSTYKTEMVGWLSSDYASSGYSLWQIARGQNICPNETDIPACFDNGGTKVPSLSGNPFSDINTTALKNKLWISFRNLYASARDNQVNAFIAAAEPLSDAATLISQGYLLRFGTNNQTAAQYGWTWFPSSPGSPPTLPSSFPDSSLIQTYQARCESYIPQWRNFLLQCDTLANMSDTTERNEILEEILEGMVSVCERGSDQSNPFGSSTVAQHTDSLPDSFEEVVNDVYSAHGINPPKDYFCNPFVIEFPKPHGKNPVVTQEYTSIVDSCACERFSILAANATDSGYTPSSLSSMNAYLWLTYHDTLTAEMHAALLGCSSYHHEVCDTIKEPRIAACYDPMPCSILILRPAEKSKGAGNDELTIDCDDWQYSIARYFDYYNYNSPYDTLINTVPKCDSIFTAFYNYIHGGTTYTWTDLVNSYYDVCGQVLNVCNTCVDIILCNTDSINCYEVYTPYIFSTPQPLPEFLKCGFVPRKCLTCDSLQAYTAEFKEIFSSPYNDGPHFGDSNLTPEQIQQNILFARFLNFRTGYHYTWIQYAQAALAAECDVLGGVTDLVVTSRPTNTPQQYIASNSITFDPNFENTVGNEYETLLQESGPGGPQIVICHDTLTLTDTSGVFVYDTACHRTHIMAIEIGQNIYQQQQLQVAADFEKAWRAKCLPAAGEKFTVIYTNEEYHYTLYYYDQSGSLVKTVPPKGVRPEYGDTYLTNVSNARAACAASETASCTTVVPSHTFVTDYRYNSLNQVVQQHSPDADTSRFWYDRLGRLVVSQNAQQYLDEEYSYTIYDPLGRIIEVGQKGQTDAMTQSKSMNDSLLNVWLNDLTNGTEKEQITYTGYDIPFGADDSDPNGIFYGLGLNQRNMRNRVSYSYTKNLESDGPSPLFYTGTFYTYDIHGNVDTLLQDYSGIATMQSSGNSQKRIVYDYDLISGKVNRVSYQPDWYNSAEQAWTRTNDKFFHKYEYDAENRITEVFTSRDKIIWERDAAYTYYKYGPLARTKLGQLQVQGLDYAYTIQGWLKGVNSTKVSDGTYDIGKDGYTSGANSHVARDVYGFALHYFDDGSNERDYRSIGNTTLFARPDNGAFVSLYNGNIGAMSVNNAGLLKGSSGTTNAAPLFYNYRYDQLNRIRSMNAYNGLQSGNTWTPVALNDYKETISYDPNGNIESYIRHGSPAISGKSTSMDSLNYFYNASTNRLNHVEDNTGYTSNYTEDIDNQSSNNYTYDAIGNLISDDAEGINLIEWTVYGKISHLQKESDHIYYTYDAAGNRISKVANGKTTIYVRDASGNVMSIYEAVGEGDPVKTEDHLYGSSRIGIVNKLTVAPVDIPFSEESDFGMTLSTFTRGEKNYELSNHLGNVLVTITDKKIRYSASIDDYYGADVVSAVDYFPFGMTMPGRSYSSDGYRYGFNGKEKDKDISAGGQDYGLRIYDTRLGKFFSVDPLTKDYPWYTPYQFAGNMPILAIDLDGAEPFVGARTAATKAAQQKATASTVTTQTQSTLPWYAHKWTNFEKAKVSSVNYSGSRMNRAGQWLYNNIIGPAWNTVVDGTEAVLNPGNTIYNIKEGIGQEINNVVQWWENNPDPINGFSIEMGKQWDNLKESYSTPEGQMQNGQFIFSSIPFLKFLKPSAGIGNTISQITNAGERLKGFEIPKTYTYTSGGKSIFVAANAMKHLEELYNHASSFGTDYTKLLGQIYQKAIHSAIDDVLSRGEIVYDKMYYSGGNEIMFGAPRNSGELPAVKHFR